MYKEKKGVLRIFSPNVAVLYATQVSCMSILHEYQLQFNFFSVGCTLALIIVLVVPILMIYYGVVHYNQCRAQKPLPLYLVVAGSSGVFKIILFVSKNLCKKFFLIVVIESPATLFVYSAFMFVWFILGNVWVFEIFWPNLDDPKAFNYCCKQVYLLALTVIVGSHVFFFVGICCMVAAYVTSQNKVRSEAPPIPSSVQIQEIRRERT